MFDELFMEYISRIVRAELTKHNLEVVELKAEIAALKQRFDDYTTNTNALLEQNNETLYTAVNELRLHTQAEQASTQTRTDEELNEFIVSAVRNECDIEDFIDERIENALDNSEFIKSDALEDAISEKLEYASIKIRF